MSLLLMLIGTIAGAGLFAYSILRLTEQDVLDASHLPFADEPDYKPQTLFKA